MPRADVEMKSEEEGRMLGSRSSKGTIETEESHQSRETRKAGSGHAVHRNWCLACVEGRGIDGQHRIELLDEEERERATPIVAFDDGFMTQDNASTCDLSRQ